MSNVTKTRGAVIYTRVSTGEQAENGTSLDSQKDACRQKALSLGLPIVAEYEDAGISGGFLTSRPGMMAAVADIQAGRGDTLICANVSRYSRDVEHQKALQKSIRAAGGRIVFCDMDFADTPEGDMMFTFMGGYAEYEKQAIRRRTMDGKRKNADNGRQTARGKSPFGYHIVQKADVIRGEYPAEQLGHYFIVEEQAALVRELFARFAAGGESLYALCRWMNGTGVPSPGNKGIWWPSALQYILRNTTYRGEAFFGKHVHRQDEARLTQIRPATGLPYKSPYYLRPADPSEWIMLPCPAIVDRELWERANARLTQNNKDMGGHPARTRMLACKVCCPHCGGPVDVLSQRVNTYKGKKYYGKTRRYICRRYQRLLTATGEKKCVGTIYAVDRTEEAVTTAILDACARPEFLADALAECARPLPPEAAASDPRKELAAVEKALAELKAEEGAAVQAQIAGLMAGASADAYAEAFAQIAARRKDLEERRGALARTVRPRSEPAARRVMPDTQELLAKAARVLTSPDVPGLTKRQIVGTLIDRVYCQPDGAEVVFLPGLFDGGGTDCVHTVQSISMTFALTNICCGRD